MSECERMIPVSRRPDHAEERCGREAVATVRIPGRVWRGCVEHAIAAEGAGANVTWHDEPRRSWVFSFGSGQTHPVTGERLDYRFLEIPAESYEAARAEMVRRFGTRWGLQYASREAAGTQKYELRPLEGEDALGLLVDDEEHQEQRERDFNASQDPENHRGPDGVLGNDFRDGSDA